MPGWFKQVRDRLKIDDAVPDGPIAPGSAGGWIDNGTVSHFKTPGRAGGCQYD